MKTKYGNYLFIFICLLGLASCQSKNKEATIIPPVIVDTQPSWDGEEQNSGLIDYIDGEGFLITKKAAERYTFLTGKFGQQLTPPVEPGQGLKKKGKNFILTPEYMSVFMQVSRLNKQ